MNPTPHIDSDDDLPIDPSDAQIIRAVRRGDISDFALLWRRHVDAARRAARAISPSTDPDDLVSEAFASILRVTKAGGGPSDAFRPYLFATLRNTAARWSKGTGLLSIELVSERELAPEGSDPIERISERSSVAAVFGRLSARHRTLLWYLEVEGMKPRELAPLMGITPNAVSALALRARDSFRRAWLEAHIHDPSRSEDCRWFCERVVAQRERPVRGGDAVRFRDHMSACRGCQLVAAEIDTVSQRLRSILPAALLGGIAAGLYAGEGSAVAALATEPRPGDVEIEHSEPVAAAVAPLTDRVGNASHAVPSASLTASGLAALVAAAVVVAGSVVFTGSVLSLPSAPSHDSPSSAVEILGRDDALVEVDGSADDSQPADEAVSPVPPDSAAATETARPLSDVQQRVAGEAGGLPTPFSTAGSSTATASPRPTQSISPLIDTMPADPEELRITRSIPQHSLVPPVIEGVGAPGALVEAFDENGTLLDAVTADDAGRFALDVSGDRAHQEMTVWVRQAQPRTGTIRWADPVGPLSFATPRIEIAQELCSAAPELWGACLHLHAERDAWVELLDAQSRSLIVRLQPGADDGILRDTGVVGPVVAARYIDPTTGRVGVSVALTGGDE